MARIVNPTLTKELDLSQQGYRFIAGLDEAGRGAWAGPVVAAAVILPLDRTDLLDALAGVRDSKTMTARQRETLFETIQETALSVGLGQASSDYIDQYRIIAATRRAMTQALEQLHPNPDYLLIDALPLPDTQTPQTAFPKADATSLTVAAASIIAKVSRDRLMVELDQHYPGYDFARHKGYGTKAHRAALLKRRPCPVHRQSFAPIRALLDPV